MAKDKITEYDATANNNTVCGDVNIAENSALPSDMNNFAREIMSHLKEGLGSGTPLYVDQTNNRVGIGSSPSYKLDVDVTGSALRLNSTTSQALLVISSDDSANAKIEFGDESDNDRGAITYDNPNNAMLFQTNTSERMRIDSSGNVMIGTTSPQQKFTVSGGSVNIEDGYAYGFGDNNYRIEGKDDGANARIGFVTGNSERMRIDSSGNVGIGTSSPFASRNHGVTISGTSPTLYLEDTDSGSYTNCQLSFLGGEFSIYTGIRSGTGTSGSVQRLTIDSSGRVGIGASNNGDYHANNDDLLISTSGSTGITIASGTSDQGRIAFADGTSDSAAEIRGLLMYNHNGNSMSFFTNSTERMRIDSSGRFLLGTGAAIANAGGAIFQSSQQNNNWTSYIENYISSGNVYGQIIRFSGQSPDNNSSAFLACQDGSGTVRLYVYSDGDVANHDNSYGAISDEKLKEQITDASSQWEDVKALRVRKFKLKEDVSTKGDSDNLWRLGVVAQEVETAGMNGLVKDNPDLIENENGQLVAGSTTTKSVKYSILYMKAVKALQEAMTRIETLEASNTALEARIVALETA